MHGARALTLALVRPVTRFCVGARPLAGCRRLDPSIPMPGLLNLSTPPCIIGVTPRCLASNGLSSVKISVYGTHIQGGKILARCGGRYLSAT